MKKMSDMLRQYWFFDPRKYAERAEETERDHVSFVNGAYCENQRLASFASHIDDLFRAIDDDNYDDAAQAIEDIRTFLEIHVRPKEGDNA